MNDRKDLETRGGETGYSWLYTASTRHGCTRKLVTLLVIGLGIGLFVWWIRLGRDSSPDSYLGLAYAIIGTLLLLLAATLFSLRRRSRHRRKVGGLRASLGWHMGFALMGLAFLLMHSFGELNLRTGTYALYGLVALVISGLIGRLLDRLMPRKMAEEAHRALTLEGEDRLETISQKLQAIVVHHTQHVRTFAAPSESLSANSSAQLPALRATTPQKLHWREQTLHTPWDMAYISLEATPQELSREQAEHRLVPDKKSTLTRPGALMPGTQEQIDALAEVQQAMRRELIYRYVTRYWRRFHILLALVTLGLIAWHIEFALQLMLPTLLH